MEPVRHSRFGRPLVEALGAAVADAKRAVALAPVTVATPSNLAGLSLRRELARTGIGDAHGLVNVRFMVFPRLAELIAAPLVVATRPLPLTPLARGEAVRRALAEAGPHPLEGVLDHPETERAVDAAIRALALVPAEVLDSYAARGGGAAYLVSICKRFRELTADRYDDADLFAAAAEAAGGNSPVLRDLGHVVLLQVRPYTHPEEALASALERAGRASRVVPLVGEASVDAPLVRSTPAGPAAPLPPTEGTRLLVASDADLEVRTVVQQVGKAVRRGTPAHRIGIFYRLGHDYEPILRDCFAASGIPFNGPVAGSLASTAAGRVLQGAFRVAARDFRREDVMEWLTASPVCDGSRPVPSRLWHQAAREAGVVRGLDQWQQRLARFAAAEHERSAAAEREDQPGRAVRSRRLAEAAQSLSAFVDRLARRLGLPMLASWEAWASSARAILDEYLDLRGAGEDEQAALQAIQESIDEIGSLGRFRDAVDRATFVRTLDEMLQSPASRHGRFGAGVFAGPLSAAPGLIFDLVFVLGMIEGQLPPAVDEDPLLPDRERAALAPHVPLAAERRARERRDYLAALHAAPVRVLSFPAGDLRGQRKNLPSRWLLEMAGELTGRRIDTDAFAALPSSSWLIRRGSFHAAVHGAEFASSPQEYDLRSLARSAAPERHYLAAAEPAFGSGLGVLRARRGHHLSRWDGLAPGAEPPAVTAPTRLERWLKCPFSYFLEDVLRVEGREEPADAIRLSPIDRGNIIHNALERFFIETRERAGAGGRWMQADRDRLLEIAADLCQEAEEGGRAGKPALWNVERARILADLAAFLAIDEQARQGLAFAEAEFAFGREGDPHPPVKIPLPSGATLRFRGRIDRVDRAPGSDRVVLYDYKTGSPAPYQNVGTDVLGGGRHLQLAMYAEAARAAFASENVEAYYWFVSATAPSRMGGRADGDVRARLGEVLGMVISGMAAGTFPANPGSRSQEGNENCRFCPYDALCPADRARAWERKRGDPAIAQYVALCEAGSDD